MKFAFLGMMLVVGLAQAETVDKKKHKVHFDSPVVRHIPAEKMKEGQLLLRKDTAVRGQAKLKKPDCDDKIKQVIEEKKDGTLGLGQNTGCSLDEIK